MHEFVNALMKKTESDFLPFITDLLPPF